MSVKKVDLERRRLLLRSFYGGISSAFALEYMTATPMLGNFLAQRLLDPLAHSLDAFPLISDAMRGGSSFLKVHQAMALDSANDWTIVTVKVVNHVATSLVFGLGKIAGNGSLDLGAGAQLIPDISGAAKNYMTSAGVLKISDMPRYRNLRLNKWFADMLHFGTSDGKPATTANLLGVPAAAIKPFPTNVALQAGLHLTQGNPVNHSIAGFKIRPNLPDLAKYVEDLGILKSPLGITCFMMGNQYDSAEGSNRGNIICSDIGEVPALGSKTVDSYVRNIAQNISSGYTDIRATEENLTSKFDRLANGKSALRKELLDSRAEFIRTIGSLTTAGQIEQAPRQLYDPLRANGQSGGASAAASGAGTEFLGQCHYTAQAISGLAGTPLRNFSLFLNTNDLDGQNLDTITNNATDPDSIKSLTYIEGMRQLAMGLNILAQPIAAGKKVIVQVLAEGGRSQGMADDTISFMFVMGPQGAGLLADNLMANSTAIDIPSGPVVINPGAAVSGTVSWTSNELTEENGQPSVAGSLPSVGDMQMGVVEFLADVTGQKAKMRAGSGRFVKLKRG
jgi:hypothetical protein